MSALADEPIAGPTPLRPTRDVAAALVAFTSLPALASAQNTSTGKMSMKNIVEVAVEGIATLRNPVVSEAQG